MRSFVVLLAFVNRSASGLPAASVSNGTEGGRFVPRRRTYCEAVTAWMRNDILRYVVPSEPVTAVQGEVPAALNLRMTSALVFFAAAGTTSRLAVEPSSRSHAVLRGHSP